MTLPKNKMEGQRRIDDNNNRNVENKTKGSDINKRERERERLKEDKRNQKKLTRSAWSRAW